MIAYAINWAAHRRACNDKSCFFPLYFFLNEYQYFAKAAQKEGVRGRGGQSCTHSGGAARLKERGAVRKDWSHGTDFLMSSGALTHSPPRGVGGFQTITTEGSSVCVCVCEAGAGGVRLHDKSNVTWHPSVSVCLLTSGRHTSPISWLRTHTKKKITCVFADCVSEDDAPRLTTYHYQKCSIIRYIVTFHRPSSSSQRNCVQQKRRWPHSLRLEQQMEAAQCPGYYGVWLVLIKAEHFPK